MKLKEYLKKEEQIPTTKKFRFYIDNPSGEWLQHERERAKKQGRGGSVTAGFRDIVSLPTSMLVKLKGKMGEKRSIIEPRVQELKGSIKQEGIKTPIFITVEYNGESFISEGNRRVLVAKVLGIKEIPCEIRYYAGGERIKGLFHPDNIAKIGKSWK